MCNFDTIVNGLQRLQDVCDLKMRETTAETWFVALSHLSDETVKAGFVYLIRELTSEFNRKPRPGDIVQYARRISSSNNGEAWQQVYRAAMSRAVTELSDQDIPDPAVRKALQRIGGLKEIALCENERLSTIRAQFNRVYSQELETTAEREIAVQAGALPGAKPDNILPFNRGIGAANG